MTPSNPPGEHLRADIAHPSSRQCQYRLRCNESQPRRWVAVTDVDAATGDQQIGGWSA